MINKITNDYEKQEQGINQVEGSTDFGKETKEDSNYPSYLNDLRDGSIQSYVSQQISNGRIKILKDSKRDPRSRHYLSEEGWEVLAYSAQLLCEKPSIDSLSKSLSYVNSIVGDNEMGIEIAGWLATIVFADAQRVYDAGKNIAPNNQQLEIYVKQKKELIEKILEKYPSLEGLQDLSIIQLQIELQKIKLNP